MLIKARNNLHIPIRLTLTNASDGKHGIILITVGEGGTALKDFYRVCIDMDLSPNKTWEEVGELKIENDYKIAVCGV